MKYEINLLPPKAIAFRKENIIGRRERKLFIAVMASCVIVLVSYGIVWMMLTLSRDSYIEQIASQNRDQVSIVEQSEALNTDIARLDAHIATHIAWTSYIDDVVTLLPNGIRISRIELVEMPETLVITGSATTGSAVVEYQEALEELEWVDRVAAPLQNFARAPEATIEFTIFHKKSSSL